MINLVRVELRRALARRLTRIFMIVAVLGIALAGTLQAVHSVRNSPDDPRVKEELALCDSATDGPPGAPGSAERDSFCNDVAARFGIESHEFTVVKIPGAIQGSGALIGVALWLIGASYIGAEWRAGTVTTLLTWESRRARLLASKLIAALIVALAAYIAIQLIYAGVLWIVAATRGSTAGFTPGTRNLLLGTFGRCAAFVAIMTTIGFAIGNVGRNTAAAVGVGFVYTAILENVLRVSWKSSRPWLFVSNVISLISGRRFVLDPEVRGHEPLAAGLTLALYAAVLTAASFAWFRARDVT